MKRLFQNIGKGIFAFGLSMVLFSCDQAEPDDSPYVGPEDPEYSEDGSNLNTKAESTVLIYAVATNSLKINLEGDKNEMLVAGESIDLNKNNILIFETRSTDKNMYDYTTAPVVELIKLVKKGDGYDWEVVKSYNMATASLDPSRIREVINYVTSEYIAEHYGLVFWSHSTASNPYFPSSKSTAEPENLPMAYSFGEDRLQPSGSEYNQINVDDLAEAVPDNLFDYIWFDSCYMSNIETIYEFRNKCKYFIGAPTEVPAPGMPYHYTLPYLTSDNYDVAKAAELFFTYYVEEYSNTPATIAVMDMAKLDILKDFCQLIYEDYSIAPGTSSMLKYTNNATPSYGPFYDLGDYVKVVANRKDIEISHEEWQELLSEFVIYKAATSFDYNRNRIDPERYSGISTYIYDPSSNSVKEAYFESLGWFQNTYLTSYPEQEEEDIPESEL